MAERAQDGTYRIGRWTGRLYWGGQCGLCGLEATETRPVVLGDIDDGETMCRRCAREEARAERRALAEAKPELYQALAELVAAIRAIECWDDDCPYLVQPMEKARRALAAAHA